MDFGFALVRNSQQEANLVNQIMFGWYSSHIN